MSGMSDVFVDLGSVELECEVAFGPMMQGTPTEHGPARWRITFSPFDLPAPVAPQSWSGLPLPTNTPAGDGRVMVHDDTEVVPARPLPLLAHPALAQGHEARSARSSR